MASVRIVLVNPLYGGNIGSVARLAANYEVDDVVLVSPRCDLRDPDALKLATGVSAENLVAFRVVDTLSEALLGCARRFAFSCRNSLLSLPEVELCNCREWFVPRGSLALVFGPEDTGLQRDDLALCSEVCSLPVSSRKNSLNLSHAVAVVLSRVFELSGGVGEELPQKLKPSAIMDDLASAEEFAALMERWQAAIKHMGFDGKTGADAMGGKIRNALLRSRLTSHEVATFHAFLRGVEAHF